MHLGQQRRDYVAAENGAQQQRWDDVAALHDQLKLSAIDWTPDRSRQARELTTLGSEIVRRWRNSNDPILRGEAAVALLNQALFALHHVGREEDARQGLAAIGDLYSKDPPGVSVDVDRCVCVARQAPAILDQIIIDDPEFNVDYLRTQQEHFHYDQARLRQLVQAARDMHESSVGRLRSALCTGEPIVLVLRRFVLTERSGDLPEGSVLVREAAVTFSGLSR